MNGFRTNRLNLAREILALLIVSINIREPLFHTRESLFALLIITSFDYMKLSNAKYALALVAIWCVSTSYNVIVPGSNIKFSEGGFDAIIVSGYLLLMCFCQKRFARTIIDAYLFVSVVVALVTISLWLACFFSEAVFTQLSQYFAEQFEKTGLSFIGVTKREILGTTLLTVWYRTSPCMVSALGYLVIQRLEGKGKYTIRILLLAAALVMSGTRANIMASILLIVIYIAYVLRKKGAAIITIAMLVAAVVLALFFVQKFLNDRNSYSSAVKVSDAKTYMDIFESDPLRTLLFGWGCGSTFLSKVREQVMNVSELTLFETIRRYGMVATCIIMFWIWLTPLRGRFYKAQKENKLFYLCALLAYILVGFTNPYLIDSVGFCALLFYNAWFRFGGADLAEGPRPGEAT